MVWFLVVFAVVTAAVMFYVLHGRAWLKTKPWAAGFFETVEPVEIALYRKSETLLWSRFLVILGILPIILDQFRMFNTPDIIALLSPEYRQYAPLVFTLIGIITEVLRRSTTKPVELVAIHDKAPIPVVAAAAKAEMATEKAVQVVETEAKIAANAALDEKQPPPPSTPG